MHLVSHIDHIGTGITVRTRFLFGALWLFTFSTISLSQDAGLFFPSSRGNAWTYLHYPLDSLQVRQSGLASTETDSLIASASVGGQPASILRNSASAESTIVHVQGSTIFEYATGYPRITSLLQVDSLGLSFVWDYLAWYPYMDLSSAPGMADSVLYIKNQTVMFQGHPLSLVIYVTSTKGNDTTITVPAGSFTATPFSIVLHVNIPKSQPPIGHFEVPLFTLVDSLFIANGKWLVREVQPSTYYPLNNDPSYNVATTQLPGFERVLQSAAITSVRQQPNIVRTFALEQNFPNPFNPTTNLRFTIVNFQFVQLRVFDVLGRQVAELVNKELSPGTYTYPFGEPALPSGIYFYRLTAGMESQTKKMILLK
ncbi:MAG TPA: T9SS type A sorting domain-containing protein [Bacteroidota bacterium]|nr:T9SS type A sorting domain-containing protein [Bacteroidota bacterium]